MKTYIVTKCNISHDIKVYGGANMATISFDREISIPKENIHKLIDAMRTPSKTALELPDTIKKLEESRVLLKHVSRSSFTSRSY